MCSLGPCARVSLQLHRRGVFFSSLAKSSCSCSLVSVGCNLRIYGERKALKFPSFGRGYGGSSSGFSDRVCSRKAVPDAEGIEHEAIHGRSYNGNSPKSSDGINAYPASFGYNTVIYEGDKVKEAWDSAIGFLASRAISVAELRKKLSGKKFSRKVVESVIADLRNRGMVNDELYAESFSRSRWLAKTWGPLRIKRALLDKGVSKELANKASAQVFEEEDPNASDSDQICDICQMSLDHLFTQAAKQWLRYQGKSPMKKRSSMISWLKYRGFSWVTINAILTKLESECPPTT